MERHERTRVLIEGDPAIAQRIAAEIEENHEIKVLDAPHEELVMIKVRESAQNSLFYLCEALMSSCRVCLDEVVGIGMVLGDKRNLAYNLALIDAFFSAAKDADRIARWTATIEKEGEKIQRQEDRNTERLERTRVDFSTMEIED